MRWETPNLKNSLKDGEDMVEEIEDIIEEVQHIAAACKGTLQIHKMG